jgi:hypothetical protein
MVRLPVELSTGVALLKLYKNFKFRGNASLQMTADYTSNNTPTDSDPIFLKR